MAELSPAAQAVLDATWVELNWVETRHLRWALNAALRVVSNQVVPLLGRSPDDSREDERLCVRDEILAIAAELEHQ